MLKGRRLSELKTFLTGFYSSEEVKRFASESGLALFWQS